MAMQIPENPSNNDIRDALIQLGEKIDQVNRELGEKIDWVDRELSGKIDRVDHKLSEKIEKSDYKFDVYQKGTDSMVKMANTIVIAAASVVVLSNLSPEIAALVTALSTANGH